MCRAPPFGGVGALLGEARRLWHHSGSAHAGVRLVDHAHGRPEGPRVRSQTRLRKRPKAVSIPLLTSRSQTLPCCWFQMKQVSSRYQSTQTVKPMAPNAGLAIRREAWRDHRAQDQRPSWRLLWSRFPGVRFSCSRCARSWPASLRRLTSIVSGPCSAWTPTCCQASGSD